MPGYYRRLFFIAVLAILLLPKLSSMQQDLEPYFENISIGEGLSHHEVMSILMDSRGFLWIGTLDGLNRYDGYNFKVYKNIPNDSTSISSNIILDGIEDSWGNLWFATLDGLNRYDLESDIFIRYKAETGKPNSFLSNSMYSIQIDSFENLWVSTNYGLSAMNLQTGIIRNYLNNPDDSNSVISNSLVGLYIDSKNRVWAGSPAGFSIFEPDENKFINFRHDPDNPQSLGSSFVSCFKEDSKGQMWVGTYDRGVSLFNEKTGSFKHFMHNPADNNSLAGNQVEAISMAPDGSVWFGTNSGLSRFNEDSQDFINYTYQLQHTGSLSDNGIRAIFFDPTNTMWLGTRFGGINFYDPGKRRFTHYKRIPDEHSLSGNNITAFEEDELGNIWVGVDGSGLNYFDRQTNRFSLISFDTDESDGIEYDKTQTLLVDNDGILWIGYWEAGIIVYDAQTGSHKHFRHDPDDPNSLQGNSIYYIFQDRSGDIWVSTWTNGISRFNRNTGNFTRYDNRPDNPHGLPRATAMFITDDHLGNLWFPMVSDGLYVWLRDEDAFIRFKSDDNPGSISSNSVLTVFEDSRKRMWVGTNGGGLCLFERETQTFKTFSVNDGLPDNVIVGILEDDDGLLWLSTNNGISMFDPDNLTFSNYDTGDGLQSNYFKSRSFFKLSTGELLFGGINGFNLFDPISISNLGENPFIPPVYFTGFRLFNQQVPVEEQSVLTRNILLTERIELSYKQNIFSFEFAALNFRNPDRNQYKYLLEGVNSEWIDLVNERHVSFVNLSPGKYNLRVIGSNNDGVWNLDGATLEIIVNPPFWATKWFRGLVLFLIITIIYFIFRARVRQLREKRDELERLVADRTKEITHKNEILEKQKEELEDRSEEIMMQSEEITQQAYELERHRDYLEQKVEERTRELLEAKEKAEESDRLKTAFLNNMSHEIRTPMNAIIGFSSILDDPRLTREKIALYSDSIIKSGNNLLSIINDIFDVSNIDAGLVKLKTESVNVNKLLNDMGQMFHSELQLHGRDELKLIRNSPDDDFFILTDKNRLRQILVNLLSNAIKYTKEGFVEFGYEIKDRELLFYVKDSGIGIAEEVKERIFERFMQFADTPEKLYGGTGLGLAIARGYAELLGGRIWVESTPGKGSTFCFTISYNQYTESKQPRVTGKSDEVPDYSFGGEHIHIVEDNDLNYKYLDEVLGRHNLRLSRSVNGTEALRTISDSTDIDLVLMDIRIPELDGYEVVRRLRKNNISIPIISQTAFALQSDRQQSIDAGCNEHLSKPIDRNVLLDKIALFLKQG